MADTELVINIDTGVITFRNEENDAHCNCFPIRCEHAQMIERGELDVATLVAAIKKHIGEKQSFDFDSYLAERKKLNVRHTALRVDLPKPELRDRSDELVSDDDLKDAKKASKKQAKKDAKADAAESVSSAVESIAKSQEQPVPKVKVNV